MQVSVLLDIFSTSVIPWQTAKLDIPVKTEFPDIPIFQKVETLFMLWI